MLKICVNSVCGRHAAQKLFIWLEPESTSAILLTSDFVMMERLSEREKTHSSIRISPPYPPQLNCTHEYFNVCFSPPIFVTLN